MISNSINHSFAVLAYNESPFLETCISSLLHQQKKSQIYIATSTPCLFISAIAKKYNLPLIENKTSGGIASDWSFAYNNCKTKFLTLAHQDDIYLPDYSTDCIKSAQKFKKSLIVFTDYHELVGNRLKSISILLIIKRLMLFPYFIFKNSLSTPVLKKLMLAPGNPICCPGILYNRENIGEFGFDKSFSMNLDWEAGLRFAEMKGDFVYIKKKLITRRLHKDSESALAIESSARHQEDRRIFERFWPSLPARILLYLYSASYKFNS